MDKVTRLADRRTAREQAERDALLDAIFEEEAATRGFPLPAA